MAKSIVLILVLSVFLLGFTNAKFWAQGSDLCFIKNAKVKHVSVRVVIGFDENRKVVEIFKDDSDIKEIYQYYDQSCLLIVKENSKWIYFYRGNVLKLIDPILPIQLEIGERVY